MTKHKSESDQLTTVSRAWSLTDTVLSRLKTANEEKQRITRKLRSEGSLPPHEARWFDQSTDPDSGERMWDPKRTDTGEVAFWVQREEAGQHGGWEGVEHIFVEDV